MPSESFQKGQVHFVFVTFVFGFKSRLWCYLKDPVGHSPLETPPPTPQLADVYLPPRPPQNSLCWGLTHSCRAL